MERKEHQLRTLKPLTTILSPPVLSDSVNNDDETSDIEILSDTEGGEE